MTGPSRRATRTRIGVGTALGLLAGLLLGTLWGWESDGVAVLALICAANGSYVALWSSVVQTAAAHRVPEDDDELRNVPVGL